MGHLGYKGGAVQEPVLLLCVDLINITYNHGITQEKEKEQDQ